MAEDWCAACGSCVPYTPTMSCCPNWGDYDDDLLCRAMTLAWNTLGTLSGGLVGNCPVLVRPCVSEPCQQCSDGTMFHLAHDRTGECGETCWSNVCGRKGCSCSPISEIVLPGPVAEVWQVKIDGALMPVESYRIDNLNRLVRVDGQKWPSCQHMSLDVDADAGTLGVWYVPGIVPDASGLWAAGVLTCEFAKACSGGKCRLPTAVTSITRQGVSMEISSGMFPDGMTGIREVDAYLTAINPNALRQPARVWSPDLPKHRYTTWQARPDVVPSDPFAPA